MDEVKSILFISYDGMTDPLGQSQVLPYLKGLSAAGYKISLISCEKHDRFGQFQANIEAICKEANIDWHPLKYTKRPPMFSTMWDIQKIYKKANEIYRSTPFQLVHCRSYISALVGFKLKKNFGIKLLFDMRGFWADERVDGAIWNLKNPIYRVIYNYFKRKERTFLEKSDHIISLTENGKKELLSWKINGLTPSKITVIPCCVDLDLFHPDQLDKKKISDKQAELNIEKSDYVVGYVGSIGTWYMLPEMLDYFKAVKRNKPHAKFLFVTGESPSFIQKHALEKKIQQKDIIVTSCQHKEVPFYLSLFSESVFFIRPTYSKKASSPTKQGEIMAMGIPLICNAGVGDTDLIVETYQAGKIVHHFTTENYQEVAVSEIPFDLELTKKGANDFFSLAEGVEKYKFVYASLLK